MLFKVIQGHRFWYQSKAHIRLPIINIAPFSSYGWLLVKFSLARAEYLTLTLSLAVFPCQYALNDISLKTRFCDLHFRCKKYCCILNHFYVIRPESYRIRWNYTAVWAITPFKVIQGHRVWYQSKAHMRLTLMMINSNLAPILHRFRHVAFDRSKMAIFGYPSCV